MLTHEFSSNVLSDNSAVKKMDSNRNHLRRIASHKETEFSNQSIMKAMETFVEAVQEMDETILVPSRLMDLQVGDDSDAGGLQLSARKESECLDSTNLYSLYSLVNCVKKELLWSTSDSRTETESRVPAQPYTPSHKGHIRRPSTASMASTNSSASTISDTDSEAGIENDSGVEGESDASKKSYTEKFEHSFRQHLYGLQRSLEQMSDAAVYLTKRYQNEVGSSV